MPRAYLTPTGQLTSTPVRPDHGRHTEANRRYRNTSAYQRARAAYRAACYANGWPTCHLCGRLIAPDAFTVDHVQPTATGGAPLDRGNFAPAHRVCNSRRGDGRGGSLGTVPHTTPRPGLPRTDSR